MHLKNDHIIEEFRKELGAYGLSNQLDELLNAIRILHISHGKAPVKISNTQEEILKQLDIGFPILSEKGKKIGTCIVDATIELNMDAIKKIVASFPPRLILFFLEAARTSSGTYSYWVYEEGSTNTYVSELKELDRYKDILPYMLKIADTLAKEGLVVTFTDFPYKSAKKKARWIFFTFEIAEKISNLINEQSYSLEQSKLLLSQYKYLRDPPIPTLDEFENFGISEKELEKIVEKAMQRNHISTFSKKGPVYIILDRKGYEETVTKPFFKKIIDNIFDTKEKGGKRDIPPSKAGQEPDKKDFLPSPGKEAVIPFPISLENEEGILFPVGVSQKELKFRDVWWWLGHTELTRNYNVGIIGESGYGKTQFVKSLIYNIYNSTASNNNSPVGFLIFDFKGDYLKPEKNDFFIETIKPNIIKPRNLQINLLALNFESDTPVTDKLNQIVTIFTAVFKENFGPVQIHTLRNSLMEVYQKFGLSNDSTEYSNGEPTFSDLIFEIKKQHGNKKPDTLISIIDNIEINELFEKDYNKCKPITAFFKGVNLIPLDNLAHSPDHQEFLCSIFTYLFYDHMYKLKKEEQKDTLFGPDSKRREIKAFILIDEAHHILKYDFDFLSRLMVEGRSFGFGTILATQHLSHFKNIKVNYGENVETWFVGRQTKVKKSDVETTFGRDTKTSLEIVNELKRLKVFEFYFTRAYNISEKNINNVTMKGIPFFNLI